MTDASISPEPEREVLVREIAAGNARTALVRVASTSPAAAVWAACTEPQRLVRWFGPVTGDLRIGGAFEAPGATGEIVQCDPDRVLTVTWDVGDDGVDEVQLRLTPAGEGTTIELEHASVAAVDDDERLASLGAGWEAALVVGLVPTLDGAPGGSAEERAAYAGAHRPAWAGAARTVS